MKSDGGPAFPQTNESWFTNYKCGPCPSGMSLRIYIAAAALPALIQLNGEESAENIAINVERAFQYADAMLAERE
jgi:thiol-disulfide isomerase/thioredoxin